MATGAKKRTPPKEAAARREPGQPAMADEVDEPLVEAALAEPPVEKPVTVRPATYARFVRRQLLTALPQICAVLLQKAVEGDMAALKMLLQMSMLDKTAKEPGSGGGAVGAKELDFARRTLAEFRAR